MAELNIKRTFEWRLHNFTAETTEYNNTFSEEIVIYLGDNETKWKFLAISNDNEVNIYLYLYDFDSKEFAVKLSSCVLNNNNEKQFLKYIHEEAACFVEGCGFDNYLDSKYILDCRENFLQNDTLTLMFKIELSKKLQIETNPSNYILPDINQDWRAKFSEMFETKIFSDFTFICSDETEIKVHSCVLAVNSSVFKAMFKLLAESKKREVKIYDVDGRTMTEVFRYIYIGEIQDIQTLAPKLMYAAEKYNLTNLKKICSATMLEDLTIENVIDYFELAENLNAKKLLNRCMHFINRNFSELSRTKRFLKLNNTQLIVLIKFIHANSCGLTMLESTLPS